MPGQRVTWTVPRVYGLPGTHMVSTSFCQCEPPMRKHLCAHLAFFTGKEGKHELVVVHLNIVVFGLPPVNWSNQYVLLLCI